MENYNNQTKISVLLACEESQAVCTEFRKLGIEAYSCDILPCTGGHPEWHIMGDLFDIGKSFTTQDGIIHHIDKFDAVIGFPPCTHLAVSGAAWFERKRESGEQEAAIEFFMRILNMDCEYIAVENPVNIISGKYIEKWFPELCKKYNLPIKQSQIIEPYFYGDNANKKTCLWLKGLPLLKHSPENYVTGSIYHTAPSGKRSPDWHQKTGKGSGYIRSKTYPGIAKTFAEQWGKFLINKLKINDQDL